MERKRGILRGIVASRKMAKNNLNVMLYYIEKRTICLNQLINKTRKVIG
jgi:hypothetical protein